MIPDASMFDSPSAYGDALRIFLSQEPLATPYIGYHTPSL